jgi:hypothetical protein
MNFAKFAYIGKQSDTFTSGLETTHIAPHFNVKIWLSYIMEELQSTLKGSTVPATLYILTVR